MPNAPTVGQYLIEQIKQLGAKEVFGIPGDLINKFFQLIENDPDLRLCTFSHEPAVGFAAIGAARGTRKPAVACVTYGPGGLNMLNSVACAYSEKVPLVVIAAGMPVSLRGKDFSMHHTIKGFDTQIHVYSEVTAEAVVLDNPETVADEIASALKTCQESMLPVYIEIPADMVAEAISFPKQSTQQPLSASRLTEATELIIRRLARAQKPVFMIGVEAVRYGLVNQIVAVAEKLGIPVVSTMLARDEMPLDAPNYYGVYLGKAGSPDADGLVSNSDFVLLLGEGLNDVNFGLKQSQARDAEIVRCFSCQVKVGADTYQAVSLSDIVSKLSSVNVKASTLQKKTASFTNPTDKPSNSLPLGADDLIATLNQFFQENGEMPTISDTGILLFATLRLRTHSVIGSSFYGTMGFGVPAAIGYAISSKKRPLVLVGDGAFQMTGQEICHCPRYGINPIFVVSNNRSWGMEQLFHSSAINDVVDWKYAEMAKLWGGISYHCRTAKELLDALMDAKKQQVFCLIEVQTDSNKHSEPLMTYVCEQKQKDSLK